MKLYFIEVFNQNQSIYVSKSVDFDISSSSYSFSPLRMDGVSKITIPSSQMSTHEVVLEQIIESRSIANIRGWSDPYKIMDLILFLKKNENLEINTDLENSIEKLLESYSVSEAAIRNFMKKIKKVT